MITGHVTSALETHIPLFLEDTVGQPHPFEAVVDTGFNGFLALPPALVATLGLPWLCEVQGMLVDGSLQVLDVYSGQVIWDGQPRLIRVTAIDTVPLAGMKLFEGNELRVRVVSGGLVAIDVLP